MHGRRGQSRFFLKATRGCENDSGLRTLGRDWGLAMLMSFFLNVALGAGLGPTAVALAGAHVFAAKAGLGPPLVLTVAVGYLIALAAVCAALSIFRARSAITT